MSKKEKQERFAVMQREAQAFLLAKHFNAVYWDTMRDSRIATPIAADLIAQFALDILDLKQSRIDTELSTTRQQLATAREVVEKMPREIPTSWLDPLLSGPKAVMKGEYDCRDIEALLRGIQDRLREAAAKWLADNPEGEK